MSKPSYSTINLFIRSCIYLIYSCVAIPIYSLLCVGALILPIRYRHVLARNFMALTMLVLEKVCLIRYHVEGLEHIAEAGNGIVLSKHQSTWETFFLPLIFHDPAVIVKRELLFIPFFGWGLAVMDPIAINRKEKASAMQQIISKGQRCLQQGRWVLMFPEGTRVAPGTIGQYKLGGARLAAATGYPIIPVAHNAGRCWPRRRFIKQPGTVQVVIGPKIDSHNRTPTEILELAKSWIEDTMVRIDSGIDKATGE